MFTFWWVEAGTDLLSIQVKGIGENLFQTFKVVRGDDDKVVFRLLKKTIP